MRRAPHEWIVRKRDGRSVLFELSRIQNAISNAFRAELNLADGQPLEADVIEDVARVVQSVADDIAPLASQPNGIDVERIQDLVEMGLTAEILNPDFSTDTFEGAQEFLKNLIGYYLNHGRYLLLHWIRDGFVVPSAQSDDRHRRTVPIHPKSLGLTFRLRQVKCPLLLIGRISSMRSRKREHRCETGTAPQR